MESSLAVFLPLLKQHEGGYADHRADPGGCTNMGITIATYRDHVDARGTCTDLKRLDWDQAERIYRQTYWRAVNGNQLPPGLDVSVFDMGVNAGPRRAVMLLQEILGVARDGIAGPRTLAAIEGRDVPELIGDYAIRRHGYYKALSTWNVFGAGWTRRLKETSVLARRLSAGDMADVEAEQESLPGPQIERTYVFSVARATVSARHNRDGRHVPIAQGLLKAAGEDPGLVDGIAGPRFDASVREFQSAHDLVVDGIVGPKTWQRLENQGDAG